MTVLVWACTPKNEEKPPKSYSIQQFMDVVPINGGAFSPDETKILITAVRPEFLMQLKLISIPVNKRR